MLHFSLQKYDLNIYEDKAKDIQDSKEKVERVSKTNVCFLPVVAAFLL